ncbi:3-dehydroquinate synthase, partial [Streptococcus sp. SPC0]|nr:3-dehydroquinate synthase [Streptococcus sp. SPC0]
IGMIQLSRVAERKNLMPRGISQDIYNMCLKFGLPVHYAEWDKDVLFDILSHDKKASGQFIKIVILPQLGSATVHQIPLEEMRDYLEK